jgi:hypothetical protein
MEEPKLDSSGRPIPPNAADYHSMLTSGQLVETGQTQRNAQNREREIANVRWVEQTRRGKEDLASLADLRRMVRREGEDGGPAAFTKATVLLNEIGRKTKIWTAVFEADLGADDSAFELREKAIADLHAYLADFAERKDELLAPIRDAVALFQREQAETNRQRAEADATRFAQGMTAPQVIEWLGKERHMHLRLNKHDRIEISNAGAVSLKEKALVKLHYSDLVQQLQAQAVWAEIEPVR